MSRASLVVILLAATGAGVLAVACSADIGTGSYYCGSNALCPSTQTCDGPTNECVLPGENAPFSCPTPTTTATLMNLDCSSPTITEMSCLGSGTEQAQFMFTVPADCTAVGATARVAFPIAFENVDVEIDDAAGSAVATDMACQGETGDGSAARCVSATVTPGSAYTVAVSLSASGAGDCGGDCAYNNYALSFQLGTP